MMSMYNLIEYSYKYSKISEHLSQYYRDEPIATLTDSQSFKYKVKVIGKTIGDDYTNNVEIAVPLKYLSNFLRTPEMPLTDCGTSFILT